MSLFTRHLAIAQRVDESLHIHNENATEELLRQPDVLGHINRFFSAKGPSQIFIFYLTPQEALAQGKCVSRVPPSTSNEKRNSIGEDADSIPGKSLVCDLAIRGASMNASFELIM